MPGVYREKECPTCATKHRKKGPYCSQGCANSDREVSDNVRKNMRKVANEYNLTPEAIAKQKMINSGISIEDFAVNIPDMPPDLDMLDMFDGYEKGQNW
jgi:hypothetical protein